MKQGLFVWIAGVAVALLVAQSVQAGSASRYEVASRLDLPVPPAAAAPSVAVPGPEPLDQRLIANLLVESIIQIESRGNPRMVGSKGERGLMQIMAATWSDVTRRHFGQRAGFDRAFDPQFNRQVGTAYLNDLQVFLTRHRAQWKADERSLLLACYNAGPERVRQCGFDIRRLPASTRDYVQRGSALHEALLADHHISTRQVRLAMDATRRTGGA